MEDYVTYEQAVKLKELGFDWKCYTFYHWDNWSGLSHSGIYENHNMFEKCVSAPTLAQATKWLREVKGINVFSAPFHSKNGKVIDYSHIIYDGEEVIYNNQASFDTYENALSNAIDKALEILKENK